MEHLESYASMQIGVEPASYKTKHAHLVSSQPGRVKMLEDGGGAIHKLLVRRRHQHRVPKAHKGWRLALKFTPVLVGKGSKQQVETVNVL